MKKKNNKENGFTLIELLAVIIILGILMIIAIPSVTSYINNSRKSAYVDTAKEIIAGARNLVNEGKLEMYNTDETYYIPEKCIKTENGSKTPYGEFTEAYVGVIYDGKGYSYYWISNDTAGQGIKNITSYEKLDSDLIEADVKDLEIKDAVDKTGINGRKTIKQLNDNCSNWEEEKVATHNLESSSDNSSQEEDLGQWDKYYYYDPSSWSVVETTTKDNSWKSWAQRNDETGILEFCAIFSKGVACTEINQHYGGSQFKLQDKQALFESKGATCRELNGGVNQDFECHEEGYDSLKSYYSDWVNEEGVYMIYLNNGYCEMWYEISDGNLYCN